MIKKILFAVAGLLASVAVVRSDIGFFPGGGSGSGSGSSVLSSTNTFSGGNIFQNGIGIGGGGLTYSIIQASSPATSVNFQVGTDTPIVVQSGHIGVGTTAPSAYFELRQSTWTSGMLASSAIFNKSVGALYNPADIVAGMYGLMINTGTVSTSGNVGHILGAVIRSSDSASGSAYTIAVEPRVDAFGEANYFGSLALVHGQHPGISTATLVAYGIDLQSHLMDDSTNNSSCTMMGIYFRNFAGGYSTGTWAWYNSFNVPMYQAGKIGIGSFASQPGDELTISNGTTGTESITTINPVMQSNWTHIAGSSIAYMGTTTNQAFALRTGSVDRLHISSGTGNVGIGTTTPLTSLDVSTGTIGTPNLTSAQLVTITPAKVGGIVWNSTIGCPCVSTGTALNQWGRLASTQTICQ